MKEFMLKPTIYKYATAKELRKNSRSVKETW